MKKWIASTIALTMIFNAALRADGAPAILSSDPIEAQTQQEPVDEIGATSSANEDALAADEPPLENTQPVHPAYAQIGTPPAATPADAALDDQEVQVDTQLEVAEVGKVSESSNTDSRRKWQRVAIAAAAVIVATIALILVSNNQGHRSH